jgi:transposase
VGVVKEDLTKDLLTELYVNQGLSINEIAKKINRSYKYVKDRIQKHSLSRPKYHLDKEWLYDNYIVKNMSTVDMAKMAGVTDPTIASALRKNNIKKDNNLKQKARMRKVVHTNKERYGVEHSFQSDAIKKKIKKSVKEKYGVENPMQNSEVRNKAEETNLKKLGVRHPAQSEDVVRKIISTKIDKGLISTLEDGRTVNQACLEASVPPVNAYRLIREGIITTEGIVEYISSHGDKNNHLETLFSRELGLEFYNKTFDLEKYPNLRYKPDFKLNSLVAINVDGLYWHSDFNGVDKNYHFNLRKDFEDSGLRIFQFREDEVYDKIEIIKSMINNAEGRSRIFYARKTKIRKLTAEEAREFFSKNHLMGSFNAPAFGLIFNGEVVMAASYKVYSEYLKIERLCSKTGTVVVGGASRLISKIKDNSKELPIHYWADLRYGTGNYLRQLGFHMERETLGFRWTDKRKTYNRLRCRANMDKRGLSQAEQAKEWGWSKIYDAGQRLWVFS